jgi:hypothetical protein
MHRRSFLKAMGVGGLFSISNWRTLARGPESGDTVVTGVFRKVKSVFRVAGATIRAGELVYFDSRGRVCPMDFSESEQVAGIAITSVEEFNSLEVATSGEAEVHKIIMSCAQQMNG